jgi:uncharacterized protein
MSAETRDAASTSGVLADDPDLAGAKSPLVHTFQTERHKYVYDANSNRITQLDDGVYALLSMTSACGPSASIENQLREILPSCTAVDARNAVDGYEKLKRTGLFSQHRPIAMRSFSLPAKRVYESELSQLIIEVTEQCNMRCKYCTYSDQYSFTRAYSNTKMSHGTATKAIDYFLAHSAKAETPAVTFYGGEPLKEVHFIVACVEYAMRNSGGRTLRFQLTTNGTCLTPSVVQALKSVDMHLLVSLDGPKGSHDANRVFEGGGGTHDIVMANLRRMLRENTVYYRTHVGFSVVLTPRHDLLATQEFFDNEVDLFSAGIIVASMVNDHGTDYWADNPVSDDWHRSLTELRWRYYRSLVQSGGTRSKFLATLFQRGFLSLFKRDIPPRVSKCLPLNGCCMPGTRRLFVDCSGHYHMCERIEPTLPIGHVERGIDLEAVNKVWQNYRDANEDQCLDCWLYRCCTKCFACAEGGNFAFSNQEERCDELRAQASATLVDYCEIMEANPFAFKFMDDIVVK